MKQSEKLDLILHFLYERKKDNHWYSIKEILESNAIAANEIEIGHIADALVKEKLIELKDLSKKLKKAKITFKGIAYCEEDSHSQRGHSIINNYHINDSPQSNIVINSNRVTISQAQSNEATKIIDGIRATINTDESIERKVREDIIECLVEIEDGLKNKQTPNKFAFKSLLGMGSEMSSISGLIITLGQLLNFIPPI